MDRIDELLLQHPSAGTRCGRRLQVGFARSAEVRRAAQALRWRVFSEELGARLHSREPGIDQDEFDRHCEHLVVRDEESGEVLGTYRLLAPEAARRVGAYYSETEFDLTRLRDLRTRMVEAGRSCIHPRHRSGAVIALLWAGLARYMARTGYGYLAGCASMSMADGGLAAAAAYERARSRHLAPIEYQVFPRRPLPLGDLNATGDGDLPALIRAYLRAGAWICGEPAWDPDFNTADFFVLLPVANLTPRYARHFLVPNRNEAPIPAAASPA